MMWAISALFLYLFIFLIFNFYFLAVSGLSCSMRVLRCGAWAPERVGSRARGLYSLWHTGSLVEACGLSSCGAQS